MVAGARWRTLSSASVAPRSVRAISEASRRHLSEGLGIYQRLGFTQGFLHALEVFAQLAVAEGRPQVALRLAAAAGLARDALGTPLPPVNRPALERAVDEARRALADAAADAAWAAGRATSVAEACAVALAGPDTSPDEGGRVPQGVT